MCARMSAIHGSRSRAGTRRICRRKTDSFDVVVSGLVLHFLSDPRLALMEMARTARPGGTVAGYIWAITMNPISHGRSGEPRSISIRLPRNGIWCIRRPVERSGTTVQSVRSSGTGPGVRGHAHLPGDISRLRRLLAALPARWHHPNPAIRARADNRPAACASRAAARGVANRARWLDRATWSRVGRQGRARGRTVASADSSAGVDAPC